MSTKPVLIRIIANAGEITPNESEVVFEYYLKHKFLNINPHTGYTIKDGGLLDSVFIKRIVDVAMH